MADLVIPADQVQSVSGVSLDRSLNAGVAINAGQVVRKSTATNPNTWVLAQGDSLANSKIGGIAMNTADPNQPLTVGTSGVIALSSTPALSPAVVYALSAATPGAIAPSTDITASGHVISILGLAADATGEDIDLSVSNGLLAIP